MRGMEDANTALETLNASEQEHYDKYNEGLALALNNPKSKPSVIREWICVMEQNQL